MSFAPAVLPRAARLIRASPAAANASCSTIHARSLHAPSRVLRRAPSQPIQRKSQQRAFHSSPSPNASVKNPYSTLGLDKSASTSEIKKAYYTAAKKYHPDSSKEPNAREKFQEVQAAYEILSDPQKKAQFDQFGEAAFDPSGGFNPGAGQGYPGGMGGGFSGFGGSGFGADFSFEDIFNAFGAGAGRGTRGRRGRNPFAEEILVGENIETQETISFLDAAHGTTRTIVTNPRVTCKPCNGSGLKPGQKRKECGRCGGTGTRVHYMAGGFQMAATCEACSGSGVTIPPGAECKTCDGNGVTRERQSVTVDIPAGIEDGMRLRVSGEGDAAASPDGTTKSRRGDLYVHIRVLPHKSFVRKGADIHYTASIPLTTAVLGGTVKVPTLDGEVELKVPTGTATGDKITMGGMGMRKIGGRASSKGDLRVEFRVGMPKSLSASQRTLLELLADEMGDRTAKRVMGVDRFKAEDAASKAKDAQQQSGEHDQHHKDGGFLKRAWDKLTHHDEAPPNEQQQNDEKKKASGSGS